MGATLRVSHNAPDTFLPTSHFIYIKNRVSVPRSVFLLNEPDFTHDSVGTIEYANLARNASVQSYNRPHSGEEAWSVYFDAGLDVLSDVGGNFTTFTLYALDEQMRIPVKVYGTHDDLTQLSTASAAGLVPGVLCYSLDRRAVVLIHVSDSIADLTGAVFAVFIGGTAGVLSEFDGTTPLEAPLVRVYTYAHPGMFYASTTMLTKIHTGTTALIDVEWAYMTGPAAPFEYTHDYVVVSGKTQTADVVGDLQMYALYNTPPYLMRTFPLAHYAPSTYTIMSYIGGTDSINRFLSYFALLPDGNWEQGTIPFGGSEFQYPDANLHGLFRSVVYFTDKGERVVGTSVGEYIYVEISGTWGIWGHYVTFGAASFYCVDTSSPASGFASAPTHCNDGLTRVLFWGAGFTSIDEMMANLPNPNLYYAGYSTLWEICAETGTATRLEAAGGHPGWIRSEDYLHWSTLYGGSGRIGLYASSGRHRVVEIRVESPGVTFSRLYYTDDSGGWKLLVEANSSNVLLTGEEVGHVCSTACDVIVAVSGRVFDSATDPAVFSLYSTRDAVLKEIYKFTHPSGITTGSWTFGTMRVDDTGENVYLMASYVEEVDYWNVTPAVVVRILHIDMKHAKVYVPYEERFGDTPAAEQMRGIYPAGNYFGYTTRMCFDTQGFVNTSGNSFYLVVREIY